MIDLYYCGNDAVYDGVLMSALSLVKANKCEIHIHLLTMDLTNLNPKYRPIREEHRQKVEQVLKGTNPNSWCKLHDMTAHFMRDLSDSKNIETNYTPYAMLRFYITEVDNIPSKILYLDTDILILGDLSPLFEIDMTNYEIAGCKDYLGKFFINPKYMNSGVLLINLDNIKKNDSFKKCVELCRTKKMTFCDQDAINKTIKNKLYLPGKYNHQRRIKKDTVVRHYCKSLRLLPYFHTLNIKPWHIDKILQDKHKVYLNDYVQDVINTYQQIKGAK